MGKLLQLKARNVQRARRGPRIGNVAQAVLNHAQHGGNVNHGASGGGQVFGQQNGGGVEGLGASGQLGGFPVQHIQHPAAKGFGLAGIGQHAQQVGATQGEHPHLLNAASSRQVHDLGHVGGEFIGVASMQVFDVNRWVFVPQGSCNLQPP